MEEQIARCPFCGSTETRLDTDVVDGYDFVACDDCGATGPTADVPRVAITYWNHRNGLEAKAA